MRCRPRASAVRAPLVHHAWAALYASTVTISDPIPPTLGTSSGTLLSAPPPAFHNATDSVTLPATDNVGIKQTTVYVDGQVVSAVVRPCDYTFVVPCSNEPGAAHQINWPALGLSDGSHQVQLAATDAAGNETRSAAIPVLVDTHAPSAPLSLTRPSSQARPTFHVSWTNPDQGQGAPIAGAGYRACPAKGSRPCVVGIVPGAGVHQATVVVPARGAWNLSVWLADAAGNANPANRATSILSFKLSAGLRLSHVALSGLGLDVNGRTAHGDTGRVHVSYRVRLHRRLRTLHATALIRHAGFHAHLRIPPGARLLRGARVVVTYAGDGRHAPARVSLPVG